MAFASGAGSGFLATKVLAGELIIWRIASASAKALRRRASKSAARAESSSARALDAAAASKRAASAACAFASTEASVDSVLGA